MKEIKSKNGITLIALIVTIIVLLILAGISIAMITGENGIATKATTAKQKQSSAEEKEKVELASNAAGIDGLGEIKETALTKEMNKEFGENEWEYTETPSDSKNYFIVKIKKTGKAYSIIKSGTVTEITENIEPENGLVYGKIYEVTDFGDFDKFIVCVIDDNLVYIGTAEDLADYSTFYTYTYEEESKSIITELANEVRTYYKIKRKW